MRVTSLIPKASSSCCFNFNFSNQQSRATIVKQQVKKKLNHMGVGELHHLPQTQKQEETIYRSIHQNKGLDIRNQWRAHETKTKRCQILHKSPKPICSENTTKLNSKSTQRSHSLVQGKSTHSLNIKTKPINKLEFSNIIKNSQNKYSRSTSISKQTNTSNLFKKQQSPFPIFQHMHSSESAQSIQIIIHENKKESTPLNLQQLNFKDIKSSYWYETETNEGSPTKEIEPFFLLSMLPSSQLPNQYAISRDPSSAELIEQGIKSQQQYSNVISQGYLF